MDDEQAVAELDILRMSITVAATDLQNRANELLSQMYDTVARVEELRSKAEDLAAVVQPTEIHRH